MPPFHTITHQHHGPASVSSVPARSNPSTAAKQSKRRVTFELMVAVQPIDCSMTRDEKSRSYYSKKELKVSRQLPDTSSSCGAHVAAIDCVIGLGADPALRGLELSLLPVRARNKAIASKGVLKYQNALEANSGKTSEEKLRSLARASAKLSHWSKLVARETARLDSLRAYGGDYLIPIDEPVDILPFPLTAYLPARR